MSSKIYTVKEDGKSLGQFGSEAKARSFLKQLKAEGRKARIHITFVDEKKKQTAVKKEAPKPASKPRTVKREAPKPKLLPKKESPKPAFKPKETPKPQPPKPAGKRFEDSFEDGWYRVGQDMMVFMQLSDSSLEQSEIDDGYKGFIDYTSFVNYQHHDGGLIPYKEYDTLDNIVIQEFNKPMLAHIKVKDPWEVMANWEKACSIGDDSLIQSLMRKYPGLDIWKKETKTSIKGPFKATVNGKKLKSILYPLRYFGDIPLYKSSFAIVDAAHVMMVEFKGSSTVFNLPETDCTTIYNVPIEKISRFVSVSKTYQVTVEDNVLTLSDGKDSIQETINEYYPTIRVPPLDYDDGFKIDPYALVREVRRVQKMDRKADYVTFYGKRGDLMMKFDGLARGMNVDVGDGYGEQIAKYPYDYVKILADIIESSDTPPTMEFNNDYPMKVTATVGGFRLSILIAPRVDQE